jgi:predicted transcriptional regulator
MSVLLSIKPKYSEKIFSGEKKYEFRTQKPKPMINIVFVYESNPTRSIVGWFRVKRIHSGSPERIWQKCKELSGIEERIYLNYCNGTKVIHAFEIETAFKFENPIDPSQVIPNFKPPQSFSYLNSSQTFKMLENSPNCITNSKKFFYRKFGDK